MSLQHVCAPQFLALASCLPTYLHWLLMGSGCKVQLSSLCQLCIRHACQAHNGKALLGVCYLTCRSDVLRIATGHGDEVQDRIVSRIDEIANNIDFEEPNGWE